MKTRGNSNNDDGHESPLHWIEDVASGFAGEQVGLSATLVLFTLAAAALIAILWSALQNH
jgi:hypothetical protein